MRKVGFFYDDVFLRHEPPPWHPDSRERLVTIVGQLKASGLWNKITPSAPRKASLEDLCRVHAPSYIAKIGACGVSELDPDTYVSTVVSKLPVMPRER